ncbi:rRNA biogenesis protein rrp36 [Plenodomus biglobosus]|nr:rRNA biogenesis protein rrp36 [Plenodomus biglobosus]
MWGWLASPQKKLLGQSDLARTSTMPLSAKLERKLQAVHDSSDDEEYYEVSDRSSESFLETGEGGEVMTSDDEEGAGSGHGESEGLDASEEAEEDDDQAKAQISKISFGALAKAQYALSKEQSTDRKRKRGDHNSKSQEDKLEALRARLRQIKAEKQANAPPAKKQKTSTKTKASRKEHDDTDHDGEGADSASDSDAQPKARSSKHAPAVQSSKRMVSRKRKVVDVKKPVFRDPRFDPVAGPPPDEHTFDKRYSFLNDYRSSEIADLRSTIKKTKNEAEKERLKKKLLSMESQQKARENKEKQQHVIREHKQKEKELVKDGKKPFFLKKSEQKKIVLIDRFQNMKSKQREHVIERRRKKVTAKERRNMPDDRRTA